MYPLERRMSLDLETHELINQTQRARQEHARWLVDPLGLLVDNLSLIKDRLQHRLAEADPDVSILIPTKDELPSFGLLQISRQLAMRNAEVVVFSNGTEDKDTRIGFELMRQVGVEVIEHDEPLGVHGGRAYGLRHADGKYVATLDSDSGPISDQWYSILRQKLDQDDSCGAVYAPVVFPELSMVPHKIMTLPTQAFLYYVKGNPHTVGPNAMFRKDALEWLTAPDVDIYNESVKEHFNTYSEDALLEVVQDSGFSPKNVFDPRTFSITDGGRFSPMYTAIVAMQRFPENSSIRRIGDGLLERMYT